MRGEALRKAHELSLRAEEFHAHGNWSKAVECHLRAAEEFRVSCNGTEDMGSKKALKLLASTHESKAHEIRQWSDNVKSRGTRKKSTKSPRQAETLGDGGVPTTTVTPPSTTEGQGRVPPKRQSKHGPSVDGGTTGRSPSKTTMQLETAASQMESSFFQVPSNASQIVAGPTESPHVARSPFNAAPKTTSKPQSQPQQQPPPQSQSSPFAGESSLQNSVMMDSFYLIPSEGGFEGQAAPSTSTAAPSQTGPRPAQGSVIPEDLDAKSMKAEIARLMKTVQALSAEVTQSNKECMDTKRLRKENDVLHKNLLRLKTEYERQAQQAQRMAEDYKRREERLIANEYASQIKYQELEKRLSSMQSSDPLPDEADSAKVKQYYIDIVATLEGKIHVLTKQLEREVAQVKSQAVTLQKYQKRWEELKASARRKKMQNDSGGASAQ
eukprot:GFYU01002816.1.p1 GENE.GFYU01002816.1~~GFYU01002816.1.p1  ORF type:complete len:439 (-),score=85.41 GFYU01002816.1:66-1382(-)